MNYISRFCHMARDNARQARYHDLRARNYSGVQGDRHRRFAAKYANEALADLFQMRVEIALAVLILQQQRAKEAMEVAA